MYRRFVRSTDTLHSTTDTSNRYQSSSVTKASCTRSLVDQLASCLIYARALLEYVIFMSRVRSVSKMLPFVKFAEDKVLTFLILRENAKIVQLESNPYPNPNFQSRLIT